MGDRRRARRYVMRAGIELVSSLFIVLFPYSAVSLMLVAQTDQSPWSQVAIAPVLGGDGGAVEHEEGAARSPALGVDDPRHELLAAAGLALDQRGELHLADAVEEVHQVAHGVRPGDQHLPREERGVRPSERLRRGRVGRGGSRLAAASGRREGGCPGPPRPDRPVSAPQVGPASGWGELEREGAAVRAAGVFVGVALPSGLPVAFAAAFFAVAFFAAAFFAAAFFAAPSEALAGAGSSELAARAAGRPPPSSIFMRTGLSPQISSRW